MPHQYFVRLRFFPVLLLNVSTIISVIYSLLSFSCFFTECQYTIHDQTFRGFKCRKPATWCIPREHMCNGLVNCADGMDEDPRLCKKGTLHCTKMADVSNGRLPFLIGLRWPMAIWDRAKWPTLAN